MRANRRSTVWRGALRSALDKPLRLEDRVRNWKRFSHSDTYVSYSCYWTRDGIAGCAYGFELGFFTGTPRNAIAARLRAARKYHRSTV